MLLKQSSLGCLAHAFSLIADATTSTAGVVGPQRDIAQYLHDTTPHAWHIVDILLTYVCAAFREWLSPMTGCDSATETQYAGGTVYLYGAQGTMRLEADWQVCAT